MQRHRSIIIGLFALLIPWFVIAGVHAGDHPKVPAGLWKKIVAEGTVRVIVELDEPIQLEGTLENEQKVKGQRRKIAAAQDKLLAKLSGTHHKVQHLFGTLPGMVLEVSSDALTALEQSQAVKGVEEDFFLDPHLAQSVPLVGAKNAQMEGYGSTGWSVAILDTGVDKAHPFLKNKVMAEACFGECPNGRTSQIGSGAGVPCTFSTDCGHGTHVAGIAAGNDVTTGLSGVANGARIMAVRLARRNIQNPSKVAYAQSDVITGLDYVMQKSAVFRIASVNMSLGVSVGYSSFCDNVLYPGPGPII
jgi:subtilisin family serine protease